MGKYFETSSIFLYTWDQVCRAFFFRYPNPHSTHVLSEDTLHREIRGDELYTRRLLMKTQGLPKWGSKFTNMNIVSIVEESYVNPVDKVITTYTRNIGLARIMSITEKVTYTPSPTNPNETVAERQAWISSKVYGFRMAIEGYGLKKFRKNCVKAAAGFNYILQLQQQYQQQQSTSSRKSSHDKAASKLPTSQNFDTLKLRVDPSMIILQKERT